MQKLFKEDEVDAIITEYSYLIGKEYMPTSEGPLTIIRLQKEVNGNGLYKIYVITNTLISDELYIVLSSWPQVL